VATADRGHLSVLNRVHVGRHRISRAAPLVRHLPTKRLNSRTTACLGHATWGVNPVLTSLPQMR
jgi:hypothetical protein